MIPLLLQPKRPKIKASLNKSASFLLPQSNLPKFKGSLKKSALFLLPQPNLPKFKTSPKKSPIFASHENMESYFQNIYLKDPGKMIFIVLLSKYFSKDHLLFNKKYRNHLVLVKPMMLPYYLKHFLQRSKSYFLISPIWHLQFLHSLLSFPNLRVWVLQSKFGILYWMVN